MKKRTWYGIWSMMLAMMLVLTCMTGIASAQETEAEADDMTYEELFPEWNPEAPALNVLIDYVVQECKELGIETKDDEEINSLIKEWGDK